MHSRKKTDILWNVVLPIIAGSLCYWILSKPDPSFSLIRNYLPDALWAYSFCSMIFIIWERKIHLPWLGFIAAIFVLFEILQSVDIIAGTGDVVDVLVYIVFGIIAVSFNKYFLTLFLYKPKTI